MALKSIKKKENNTSISNYSNKQLQNLFIKPNLSVITDFDSLSLDTDNNGYVSIKEYLHIKESVGP